MDSNGDTTFDQAFVYIYDDGGKRDPGTGVPLDDVVLVLDDSGSLISRELHGPGFDQILASEFFSPTTAGELPLAPGDLYWALADNQGTVRDLAKYDALLDETNIVNHIEYDSFGNITGESATAADYLLSRFRYSYTGQDYDADADLHYYLNRWYSPRTGGFISQDPIGFAAGDANLKRYVGNGATNWTDPSGLAKGVWAGTPLQSNFTLDSGVTANSGRSKRVVEFVKVDNFGYKYYPNFDAWSKGEVEIIITGKDSVDQAEATRAYSAIHGKPPAEGCTWHHDGRNMEEVTIDGKKMVKSKMQRVPARLNADVPHYGSASAAKGLMDKQGISLDEFKRIARKQNLLDIADSAKKTLERIRFEPDTPEVRKIRRALKIVAGAFTFLAVWEKFDAADKVLGCNQFRLGMEALARHDLDSAEIHFAGSGLGSRYQTGDDSVGLVLQNELGAVAGPAAAKHWNTLIHRMFDEGRYK